MLCTRCKCERFDVVNTRSAGEHVIRLRSCKKCGNLIYTDEHEIDFEEGNRLINMIHTRMFPRSKGKRKKNKSVITPTELEKLIAKEICKDKDIPDETGETPSPEENEEDA